MATRRVFLLDKSGSMEMRLEDTIGGFNAFVRDQVSLGGTLTLYTFSDRCTCEYRDIPIDEVPLLTCETYVPGGSTALFDSMGHILKSYEGDEDGGTFVIMTDGQENASRKFSKKCVKNLIKLSKLDIIYVGCDIEEASDMGIHNTLFYDGRDTPDILRSVSESVSANVVRLSQLHSEETDGSTRANDSNTQRCTSQ